MEVYKEVGLICQREAQGLASPSDEPYGIVYSNIPLVLGRCVVRDTWNLTLCC